VWVLRPLGAKSISLRFLKLDTEGENYDMVKVLKCWDVSCDSGEQVAYFGGSDSELPEVLSSETGIFQVTFISDGRLQAQGFYAEFEGFGGISPNCPSVATPLVKEVLVELGDTVDFFNNHPRPATAINASDSGHYLNNALCHWILHLPKTVEGALELKFPKFQTEEGYDKVVIFDIFIARTLACDVTVTADCVVVDELSRQELSGSVLDSRPFRSKSSAVRRSVQMTHVLVQSACRLRAEA
jgi:hypothetical protein